MPDPAPRLLPYAEMTKPEFAEKAAANFRPSEDADGIVLVGPCPRCAAVIEIRLFEEVVRDWFPWRSRSAPATDGRRVEPMICTCEHDHPNRPADRKGCGAYWNLALVTESGDGAAEA